MISYLKIQIAFLFNDLLVITKPKKERQVVKQMIKLSDCNVDANDGRFIIN